MLAIAWEYLTTRAVASDPADRTRAEWPPHPDRVFQALVAAWGENGKRPEGKAALEWLESQPPPHLAAPDAVERPTLPVYVPANDSEGNPKARKYGDAQIAILPSSRPKKDRRFPSLYVGSAPAALIWEKAQPSAEQRAALADLCARVTHVGHSSSLVRMWLTEAAAVANYVPSDAKRTLSLRIPAHGRLASLIDAYADGGARWRRPPMAPWQGYVKVGDMPPEVPRSAFDDQWVVLRLVAGAGMGLARAPAVADALRKTLLKTADGDAVAKALISGHAEDGSPLDRTHASFIPLSDVGHEHADGHLMGAAIALPHDLAYAERDACLRAVAMAEDPESGAIRLFFGAAGELTLVNEDREQRPFALRSATWCRASRFWASVTPVAMDRMPRRTCKDRDQWAKDQIALACERIGLPRPAYVWTLPVSRFRGAPTCREMAPLRRKTDNAPRWHVHVEMRFAEAVRGPVILGAGRYRGYGLCRPLPEAEAER